MRLRFIWIGRTRNEYLSALIDDYTKRLGRFMRVDVEELRESTASDDGDIIADESARLIEAVGTRSGTRAMSVLLDITGTVYSSPEMALKLERWLMQPEYKEIAFLVGGSFGVSDEVRKRVHLRWSLSSLTFTHEMARVLMVEQIYRALTIMRGMPYQK
ncbi:MAG: 23S rRNA (pseudouridine(1915)-N(3))-methyltransferase RlmH [Pyrinomonadaceae bacterium]